MGQNLSNGVYLPDEGERNCYSGLAANWNILNTAVGNIAGKASSSHTHGNISNDGKVGTDANKPLITGTGGAVQTGSFGNSANTFCEGNDSRLSDARTPVAHTHAKSDVTDLLNSNFIPSANNSYDLGSSSYQWNNLYSKNYYYNGTAWGLDKANVWSAWQTIEKTNSESLLRLRRTDIKIGDSTPANQINVGSLGFAGSDDFNLGLITCRDEINGNTRLVLATRQKYDSAGNRSNNGTVYESRVDIGITSSRVLYLRPYVDNSVNLGTPTNKWKTLNGVNPGALSLPSNSYTGSIAITEIDRTGWVYDGTVNTYSPPVDCWLSISNGGSITVWGSNTAFGMKATDNIAIPLRQGETYNVSLTHTPDFCRIYPCTGNV